MTGQWFGDYEIVQRLRVGGMATLYLARRHGAAGFSRLVALKMIHPHLIEQAAFLDMFVDEARICSQITHPNVVHVEEFGAIDGIHYLVMEYLDGCSVAELLRLCHRRRRALDPELAARIVMQIAAGLHAAHETRDASGEPLEIVHRDISPSNILLSIDGNAKLIDFGIAKARNRLSATHDGVALKGKFNYVAPEQATRSEIDRRCDVFSLGIVFWEMLVGRRLFRDDNHLALFHRLQRTEVEPPSSANPDLTPVFDALVLAMLHHDPEHRPQTAAEVERRIAAAAPGAANREASELGALAREARDAHVARRAAEDGGSDSQIHFSPTPRTMRPASSSAPREGESKPGLVDGGTATTQPPMPSRWTGRRVQLGAGAAIVAVAAVILVVAARGGRTPAAADGKPSQRTVELFEAPPAAPPPRPTPAMPSAPPAPAPAAALAPAAAPAPEPAVDPAAVAASPPPAAAPAPIASPPVPAAREVVREPVRNLPRPRQRTAQRAAASDSAPAQAPAPSTRGGRGAADGPPQAPIAPSTRSGRVTGDAPPFVKTPFDDADNERVAPPPPSAVKVKKTPVIPGFDN